MELNLIYSLHSGVYLVRIFGLKDSSSLVDQDVSLDLERCPVLNGLEQFTLNYGERLWIFASGMSHICECTQ